MITLPSSEYFILRQIATGIYAAIAKDGSPAFSNVGVVDTGDHILAFDTFNTFRAALDLSRDIEIITKRLVNYVVISHSHSDHWMGNQVFADHATILASRKTTDAIIEQVGDFVESKRNPGEYEAEIGEISRRLSETQDSRLQSHLTWSQAIWQHEYENLDVINPQLPNQSFDSKLDIYGKDALVKIMSLGAGHTACDTVLLLPEDRIAFIGDLGFFQTHPYLGSSDPKRWVALLDELMASKINIFVPGHGPIGTKEDLLVLKKYIITLQVMVAAVVKSGGSEDDAAAQSVPAYAADWAGFGRFEQSMRYLYQLYVNQDKAGVSQVDLSRSVRQEAEEAGYILDGVEIGPSDSNPPPNQST